MLMTLSPEEVIESRRKLLNDLEEALLGNPANWRGEFPGNFELYNMLNHIFNFWEQNGR